MARISPVQSSFSALDLPSTGSEDTLESSVGASLSSTPPTSLDDNASEMDVSNDLDRRRSARVRNSVTTYNDKVNAGTAVHTRRSFLKPNGPDERSVSGATLVEEDLDAAFKQLPKGGMKTAASHGSGATTAAVKENLSANKHPVRRTRKSEPLGPFASKLASTIVSTTSFLGKRASNAATNAGKSMRSLVAQPQKRSVQKRKPMVETWTDESDEESGSSDEEMDEPARKKPKFVEQGLYYGTVRHNPTKKKNAKTKEEDDFAEFDDTWLPLPMGVGQRLLEQGRDFKLPFNVLNPLPNDQAPKDWHRLNRNRFIGDSTAVWKKNYDRLPASLCVCNPKKGCQEDCLNRAMQYECNKDNCNAPRNCKNRPFAELKWRSRSKNEHRGTGVAESNMWGEGVEVVKTGDRGYGVRAMRSFEPGQIIVEYCGEIITPEEADRRMNENYKGKTDYYMMTFHERLIIDATRGSICRFVNHSCGPNCRVEKWTVDGEPRMALFAGDAGIMTGEELTYDYNFDPFSDKNVQRCLCGARNCRGVIGPKPTKDKLKETAKKLVQTTTKTLKRTINRAFGNDVSESDGPSPKKRRKTEPKSLLSKLGKQISNKATPKRPLAERKALTDGRAGRKTSPPALKKVQAGRVGKRHSSAAEVKKSAPKKEQVKSGWRGWALLPEGAQRPRTLEDEMRELIEKAKSGETRRSKKAQKQTTKPETSKLKQTVKDAIASTLSPAAEVYNKKRASLLGRVANQASDLATNSRSSSTSKLLSSQSSLQQSRLTLSTDGLGIKPRSTSSSPQSEAVDARGMGGRLTKLPKSAKSLTDVENNGRAAKSTPPQSPRARPSTAHSIANSVKKAAVSSVRGPQRAAAIIRMGLTGDEAIRQTIRQVSGA